MLRFLDDGPHTWFDMTTGRYVSKRTDQTGICRNEALGIPGAEIDLRTLQFPIRTDEAMRKIAIALDGTLVKTRNPMAPIPDTFTYSIRFTAGEFGQGLIDAGRLAFEINNAEEGCSLRDLVGAQVLERIVQGTFKV